MPEARRVAWVDLAKGIGIVLVVLGHTNRGLVSAGILSPSRAFLATDAWLYAFHMPLFFFLSGLFAQSVLERSTGRFLTDRARTLAYPYVVWSLLQLAMQMGLSSYTNARVPIEAVYSVAYLPVMQFWFLYALLVIFVVAHALRRLGVSPAEIFAMSVVCYAVGAFWMPSWMVAIQCVMHAPYFALGLWLSRAAIPRMSCVPARVCWVLCVLGYGGVAAAVAAGLEDYAFRPPLALAGIAATLGLAGGLAQSGKSALLATLGQRSLEIYVAHTLGSAGARVVLTRFLHVESVPVHVVAGMVAGLGGPLLLCAVCQRLGFRYAFQWPRERPPGRHGARSTTPAAAALHLRASRPRAQE